MLPNPSGQGERVFTLKPIYQQPPHLVADNHFSGEEVMNLLGMKGYGTTMTNCRDRFLDGLKPYLHHEKVPPGCPKAKAMRFEMPIVAIKQVLAPADDESAKAYTRMMVSFQSSGATNICRVNNLPLVSLYVSKRVRAKRQSKRVWGIELLYHVEVLARFIPPRTSNGRGCCLRHVHGVCRWTARQFVGNSNE